MIILSNVHAQYVIRIFEILHVKWAINFFLMLTMSTMCCLEWLMVIIPELENIFDKLVNCVIAARYISNFVSGNLCVVQPDWRSHVTAWTPHEAGPIRWWQQPQKERSSLPPVKPRPTYHPAGSCKGKTRLQSYCDWPSALSGIASFPLRQ